MYPQNSRQALIRQLETESALRGVSKQAFAAWIPTLENALSDMDYTTGAMSDATESRLTKAWADLLGETIDYASGVLYGRTLAGGTSMEPTDEQLADVDPEPDDERARKTRAAIATAIGASADEIAELNTRLRAVPTIRELQSEHVEAVHNRMVQTADTTFEAINRDILAGLDEGEGMDKLAARVDKYLGGPDAEWWAVRAETVARTESAATQTDATLKAARLEQADTGKTFYKQWDATLDSVTRDEHFAADGQMVEVDEPFIVGGEEMDGPGLDGSAWNVANCVVGSTRVSWPGQDVLNVTSRRQSGTFVDLRTVDGHVLTCTANHPVLTRAGYVPAQFLSLADYLMATRNVDSPTVDEAPPCIDQLYRAAREFGNPHRHIASAMDFHGDGSEGQEVNVVRTDPELRDRINFQLFSDSGEDTFVAPTGRKATGASLVGGIGLPSGGMDTGNGFSRDAATASVSGSTDDSEFIESSVYYGSPDSESARHLQDAYALGMEPSKLVEVNVYSGRHDVFNLHTSDNWYIGNGIAQHNCRCAVLYFSEDESPPKEIDRHTERSKGDSTVKRREGSKQDEIDRRSDEGIVRARDDEDGEGRTASISQPEDTMADMNTYRTFTDSTVAVFGQVSDDSRMLEAGMDFAFRQFPLPLMWVKQSADGHDNAFTVGVIEAAQVRDSQVVASGYMLNTPEADEAVDQIEHGVTAPSVDLGAVDWTLTDQSGAEVTEDDYLQALEAGTDLDVVQTVTAAKLLGVTLVSKPAFGETSIALDEDRASRDESMVASITASAPAEPVYSAGLFNDPGLTGPTPVHMTDEGRIVGHLACKGTCHVGITDRCVTVPESRSGYAHFHTAPPVLLESGERLAVGRLAVATGHAGPRDTAQQASAHYDNTGTCYALVRAGEDEHGVWISGVAAPGVSDYTLNAGLSAPLSGDWRTIGGNLELVAALAVNTPGFPVVASGATDDDDAPLSLVAALSPDSRETGQGTASADAIADAVIQKMDQRDHAESINREARDLASKVDRVETEQRKRLAAEIVARVDGSA